MSENAPSNGVRRVSTARKYAPVEADALRDFWRCVAKDGLGGLDAVCVRVSLPAVGAIGEIELLELAVAASPQVGAVERVLEAVESLERELRGWAPPDQQTVTEGESAVASLLAAIRSEGATGPTVGPLQE